MIGLFKLFLMYLKFGALSFGGGVMILPLINDNLAEFSNMDEKLFLDIIGASNFIPGPLGINLSIMTSFSEGGILYALIGLVGFTLPGICLTYILFRLTFNKNKNTIINEKYLLLLLPVICVFFIKSAVFIGVPYLVDLKYVLLFGVALFLVFSEKTNYFLLLILAGVLTIFI